MTAELRLRAALQACVRPLLTALLVTLPRWWAAWRRPAPVLMPTAWRARQIAADGKRGEDP